MFSQWKEIKTDFRFEWLPREQNNHVLSLASSRLDDLSDILMIEIKEKLHRHIYLKYVKRFLKILAHITYINIFFLCYYNYSVILQLIAYVFDFFYFWAGGYLFVF